MEEREKYFENFYRIWKVGPTWRERIDFWRNNLLAGFKALIDPVEENLYKCEVMHLQGLRIVDEYEVYNPTKFPDPRKIFVEKFYWEKGVTEKVNGRLRYFRSHYPEHFELNETSSQSNEKILSDCELWFIISGHESEIDPEAQFM